MGAHEFDPATIIGREPKSVMNYILFQNYPNPFNPSTTIKYQLPKTSSVKLEIFNVPGQKIRTLSDEQKEAAYYQIPWDGLNEQG